ncbi:hypothetical protein FSP39_004774 [Pinctada imbricata]|uniref:DZIP3-like HEPN domain-containing protein n=1 Tax=Pinctada imbricata TaxID=66713 RepID=A0AA88Y7D4_PINIB|nr:hypothetical protein FSP39_004774 [Pinctada imbricata]
MDNNSTMSRADEARYVRMCLLVLNVCPFTLRHVIDDYSLRHDGSLSLYDFLEKNKHSLFHLYAKRCCCRHLPQNRSTPMTKRQWDLLFISIPNNPSCQRDRQMDCPCKYQASASITTTDMDVTLCCLVINNICPGVDTSHIDTIKEIRNNLIHSTNASLDLRTFNGYWNRVKTSLRLLAQRVLPTLVMDTMSRITELESRLMNLDELQQLRNLILDERRIENIETVGFNNFILKLDKFLLIH